jgi:hypothetical protein
MKTMALPVRLLLLGAALPVFLQAGMITGVQCQGSNYFGTNTATVSHAQCPGSLPGLAGSANVDISSGTAKLGASASVSNFGAGQPFNIQAVAMFTDVVTYQNSSGPGTYQVSLDFNIDGTIDVTETGHQIYVLLSWMVDGVSAPGDQIQSGDGTWQGNTTHTLHTSAHQFTTGQAYTYTFQLWAVAHDLAPTNPNVLPFHATVDFSHTAALVGGHITNLDGSPVSGITYSTQSGLGLDLDNGAQVPEPSSLCMVLAGSALLWQLGRRHRRSRARCGR